MLPAGAVVAWMLVAVATLGAEMRWIDTARSMVTVHVPASGTPGGDAVGYVIEAPLAEGSVDDTDTPHLALVIDVGELRVVGASGSAGERRRAMVHMLGPEGLDAQRFPRITYHSLTIILIEADIWLVEGELEIHGRFQRLDVRAMRRGDRFTGTTTVSPIDFGILPIPVAGTSVVVRPELRIDFDIVLEAS